MRFFAAHYRSVIRQNYMKSKSLKLAFSLSDTWAGLVWVFCVISSVSTPIMLPAYQRMSNIKESSLTTTLILSFFFICAAYSAYLVRKRNIWALLALCIAFVGLAFFYKNIYLWLFTIPLIAFPYLFVFFGYQRG